MAHFYRCHTAPFLCPSSATVVDTAQEKTEEATAMEWSIVETVDMDMEANSIAEAA